MFCCHPEKNIQQEVMTWRITQVIHPNPTSQEKIASITKSSGTFGTTFSDHMVLAQWNEAFGWHSITIQARAPLKIDPACAALHYGQEVFEGLKAYRTEDGSIVLFRPEQHALRFVRSAERLAMQPVPEDLFLLAIEGLIKADHSWVPAGEGSLYIRPFLFASEPYIGVRSACSYTFCIVASPVSSYFKGEGSPIAVWITHTYTRAAAGGTGSIKCAGNYANSMLAKQEADQHGCDQVVFLDAKEHRFVEELGGMNIFFVKKGDILITPPLGDTILPGVTRNSVITLAKELALTVEEQRYSFEEWCRDAQTGELEEVFACGTAAAISPIGTVRHKDGEFTIDGGMMGRKTKILSRLLTEIQRKNINDSRGWLKYLN